MERKFGYIPDRPDERDLMFSSSGKVLADLPRKANVLLPHLAPIIDQMEIGCCTGASASRAAKALMNLTGYKYPHQPSALFLYAITREFEGTPLDQDTGAYIRDIFKVWNRDGVCPEDSNPKWSWPFSASDDRWKTKPPQACYDNAKTHKVTYMRLGLNPDETKSALAQGFPVVIGITVHESMMTKKVSKTGIIPKPGVFDPVLGGHALYLYGYGNLKSNYADGVNSWGPGWGDKGHFHINFQELSNPQFCSDRWAITSIS